LHSLIFGVWHSNFSEVETKIEIHNNGLLDEGNIGRFYLDVGINIGNFHFSIIPVGTLGVNISSEGRGKFLSFERGERDNVM